MKTYKIVPNNETELDKMFSESFFVTGSHSKLVAKSECIFFSTFEYCKPNEKYTVIIC